ncbi:hypothetical protein GWE18_40430 [Bradyrhizobium sp. CSA112]|uniref:hypothetical protein n=1 Tax=Bradyrhizobium sp. CSA112 TaxID=2699170 RepID=UPI0023B01D0B|nr:hypothetical protein [Bradyrhizobium sp. CSA112]MDE5458893.1 hypothetical protein [Bradyrhizobium sp. CSA112]
MIATDPSPSPSNQRATQNVEQALLEKEQIHALRSEAENTLALVSSCGHNVFNWTWLNTTMQAVK